MRSSDWSSDVCSSDLPVFAATPFGQGRFYGYRTKRFGGLLERSAHAETLALEPTTLGAVQAILGSACDRIQLNVAQAIEIHPKIGRESRRQRVCPFVSI